MDYYYPTISSAGEGSALTVQMRCTSTRGSLAVGVHIRGNDVTRLPRVSLPLHLHQFHGQSFPWRCPARPWIFGFQQLEYFLSPKMGKNFNGESVWHSVINTSINGVRWCLTKYRHTLLYYITCTLQAYTLLSAYYQTKKSVINLALQIWPIVNRQCCQRNQHVNN